MTVTLQIQPDRSYNLLGNGVLMGLAHRVEGGFEFLGEAPGLPNGQVFPTMKALKFTLEPHVPAKVPRPHRYTWKDVLVKGGLSHGELRVMQDEVRALWKDQHWTWGPAYALRRRKEMQAQWPYGTYARKWLTENPTVGAYDHDEFDRRLAVAVKTGRIRDIGGQ